MLVVVETIAMVTTTSIARNGDVNGGGYVGSDHSEWYGGGLQVHGGGSVNTGGSNIVAMDVAAAPIVLYHGIDSNALAQQW